MYLHACVHACAPACVCVCLCTCTHVCVRLCARTCVPPPASPISASQSLVATDQEPQASCWEHLLLCLVGVRQGGLPSLLPGGPPPRPSTAPVGQGPTPSPTRGEGPRVCIGWGGQNAVGAPWCSGLAASEQPQTNLLPPLLCAGPATTSYSHSLLSVHKAHFLVLISCPRSAAALTRDHLSKPVPGLAQHFLPHGSPCALSPCIIAQPWASGRKLETECSGPLHS